MRVAGTVLVKQHDEWNASDRRYSSEQFMNVLIEPGGAAAIPELKAAS